MLDSPPAGLGAAVTVRGLERRFGANAVLRGLDLAIAPGEFVSIVGKSGCGKSTLLRLIAGLDAPDGGEVRIDGRTPREARDVVRLMFQEPRLLPWASVLDNVRVGLGEGVAQEDALVAALDEVQLGEKAGEWPARLSGGQRSRVALARALVSRPRLMALDEPLGALDALTRLVMQDLILRMRRDHAFTALLVTHDVAEAVALSDRVVVLDAGRIVREVRLPLPHPRPRASAELAAFEAEILGAIFGSDRTGSAPKADARRG
jgi:sulfonate transport system ATP-binding protein